MKVLLDECVPVQLRHALKPHDVSTAQQMQWRGLSNGNLLNEAENAGFEIFIIADKNLRYQQTFARRRIAVLELSTNHRPTLEKHFNEIRQAMERLSPGDYFIFEIP